MPIAEREREVKLPKSLFVLLAFSLKRASAQQNMPLAHNVFHTTATFCSSMFSSSSSSSSSATTICNSAAHPVLLLIIMVLLSSVAAAFRSSVASSTTASHQSAAAATTTTRATDRGRNDDNDERREGLLPSASSSTASFAADVVQAAADVIERNHRRYWAETAPPFGIRSGLRKLRRKRTKQRQVQVKHEQRKSTEQMSGENNTIVETSIRSRSVITGSLLNGVDKSQTSSDDHDASSISSEYTWGEQDIDQDDDDPFDNTDPTVTHLCVLIHGHRGQSKDLSYMAAAIQGRSSEVRGQRLKELQRLESARSDGDSNGEERDDVAAAIDEIRSSLGQRVVVHSVTCNEGKTNDGVRAGGERCVEEMLQVIRKEADRTRRKRQGIRNHNGDDGADDDELNETVDTVDIHLSLVGNSLGGIYSRYAVAQLFDRSENKNDHDGEPCSNAILLDNGSIRLHFQTFCTTATPHLGCSRHTYVSLPRSAETVVGNILGETGRDLFRMNDLLYNMSTDPYFLRPLSFFQRRVAYANGYHTDFPVPTSTAAFLHEESSHAHFWEDTAAVGIGDSELDKSIVAILRTEPSYSALSAFMDLKDDFSDDCDDELHAMSKALDSLGWKKIIVDLRPEIPAISLPRVMRKSSMVLKTKSKRGTYDEIVDEDLDEGEKDFLHNNGTLADSQVLRASLRRKESIASRDAKEAFGSVRDGSLHLPVGHNMICAFSRGRVSSHMNRGGRPVMDALAKEIVNGMLGPEIGC